MRGVLVEYEIVVGVDIVVGIVGGGGYDEGQGVGGLCLFVMPTIGITLPFFSYGGSSIVTLFVAMGVVSGIKKRSTLLDRRTRNR